jgi:serine phosphatase RsbU (regulator of sigma subunit)
MSLSQANNRMEPEDLLQAVVNAVQSFSGREREDDITLVVAQGRG